MSLSGLLRQFLRSAFAVAVICFHAVNGHEGLIYQSPVARRSQLSGTTNGTGLMINSIPYATREYWMRQANEALFTLSGPCPFAAFASVVVNHTAQSIGSMGQLVCIGANENSVTGNPTLHGEISAIGNCSKILTDPNGYNLTAAEALNAFNDLTLYTNAESCPMCASAIRWSNFKEYIYGTSIDSLIETGWGQIRISSYEIFEKSFELPSVTRMIGNVLTKETDPLFAWQFSSNYPCPAGCARGDAGTGCVQEF